MPAKRTRLCYTCAKSPATSPEDLERWLRSLDHSKSEPCDRCGLRDFTCTFRRVYQRVEAACDCGGFPHGKHCAAVMAGHVEHTPTTPNGE